MRSSRRMHLAATSAIPPAGVVQIVLESPGARVPRTVMANPHRQFPSSQPIAASGDLHTIRPGLLLRLRTPHVGHLLTGSCGKNEQGTNRNTPVVHDDGQNLVSTQDVGVYRDPLTNRSPLYQRQPRGGGVGLASCHGHLLLPWKPVAPTAAPSPITVHSTTCNPSNTRDPSAAEAPYAGIQLV
jgi:hypothetical protein